MFRMTSGVVAVLLFVEASSAAAPPVPNHVIGYTEFRTDLKGGRHANVRTMRAVLVNIDTKRRRVLAERYRAGLAGIDELVLPVSQPWAEPVWHVFPVRIRHGRRDALRARLDAVGIGTNVHYPKPIHLHPAYDDLGQRAGAFPIAERLSAETLSLPLDHFHSEAEIDRVIDGLREFFRPA